MVMATQAQRQLVLRALFLALLFAFGGSLASTAAEKSNVLKPTDSQHPLSISGIYPRLASFNGDNECGIGAVVPWAGRLWWITYPPHARHGSNDKLYSIDPQMNLIIHPQSVGGTHANRLIHRESNQLLVGPYAIDAQGQVRVFDVKTELPGRLTATTRHLTDPANKVYYVDMEGPVWEADVRTLQTRKLFEKPLPGWHGKGAYTAQGRLVLSNNGEHSSLHDLDISKITADLKAHGPEDAGVLGQWDGQAWRIVERRQFTEVTGPGGIYGNEKDSDPLWATGWDKRSVILKLLDGGKWQTFRVPKGSYAFDPKHGWFTEWPRIREVAPNRLLMVMHATMFDFPKTFSVANSRGLKPICTHLRYIPDFSGWDAKLVLGADDTSIMQNPMAGQSQSNLWFGTLDDLKSFGPASGWGGVWLGEAVKADTPSDPFLFAGYARRMVHLAHRENAPVEFTFEFDEAGDGRWKVAQRVTVGARGYGYVVFPPEQTGQWVRVRASRDCQEATAYFHYLAADRPVAADGAPLFAALPDAKDSQPWSGGLVRPAGHNRSLQFVSRTVGSDGTPGAEQYWEVDEQLRFQRVSAPDRLEAVKKVCAVRTGFAVDAASVILTDEKTGRRYRLPKGEAAFDKETALGWPRAIREVVSERSLANIHGTFYEIPRAEGAGKEGLDVKRLKPVASHGKLITDFCTWRGLLVLSGCRLDAHPDGHRFASQDGQAALWFGALDDLWRLGAPVGVGGPWKNTRIRAGSPSDPFLMTGYMTKRVEFSHDSRQAVAITLEVDVDHHGWKAYQTLVVPPDKTVTHDFPEGFSAHWVRTTADRDCTATAWFTYGR